jgi:hypothetical protein
MATHQGDLGIRDLPFTGFAAQLPHGLDNVQHAAAIALCQ